MDLLHELLLTGDDHSRLVAEDLALELNCGLPIREVKIGLFFVAVSRCGRYDTDCCEDPRLTNIGNGRAPKYRSMVRNRTMSDTGRSCRTFAWCGDWLYE